MTAPPPDAFAVVMATGVISVAADEHAYRWLGTGLGVVAAAVFVVLGLVLLTWVVTGPRRVGPLTRDPDVALRMFTFVAACAVLAVHWPTRPAAQWLLGGLGLTGWLVLTSLAALVVWSRRSHQLRDHARGSWLLPSVATQGLAITAADAAADHRVAFWAVAAAAAWVLGLLVYLAVTGLIAWRVFATPFGPTSASPDSWILMGALAITAVASGHLLTAARALGAPPGPAVQAAASATLWTWVLASLWIPVLLYAEVWRARHVPGSLRYQPAWWSAVFPIGMYSAASSSVAAVLRVPSARTISLVFFWIAVALWVLVATGLMRTGLTWAMAKPRARRRQEPA